MRLLRLFLLAALAASSVNAASYQKTNGTIVDPILYYSVGKIPRPYSGNNLEPGADLTDAYLSNVSLVYADLTGADLSNANLGGAHMTGATQVVLDFGRPEWDC